jgi:hypothetical protein
VFAVFAAPSLAQQTQGVAEKSPARKSQATKQSERQQYPTENAPLPIRVIESPSDAADRQRSAASAAEHEQADLKAQERSASAAEQQVSVGTAMAWLSLAGLFALIWTLCETRRAASAAIRAANAADKAIELQGATSHKELRAYISVSKAAVAWSEDESILYRDIVVVVNFKNCGQTPARNVLSWGTYASTAEPHKVVFGDRPDEMPVVSSGVQGPDQSGHIQFTVPHIAGEDDEIVSLTNGKKTLFVWGRIDYIDIFNKARWTMFRFVMPREGVHETGGKFMFCAEGNDIDRDDQ